MNEVLIIYSYSVLFVWGIGLGLVFSENGCEDLTIKQGAGTLLLAILWPVALVINKGVELFVWIRRRR